MKRRERKRGVTIIEWQLGHCWCCAPSQWDNCELSIIGTPCLSSEPRVLTPPPLVTTSAAVSMVRSQLVRVHIVLTRSRHHHHSPPHHQAPVCRQMISGNWIQTSTLNPALDIYFLYSIYKIGKKSASAVHLS